MVHRTKLPTDFNEKRNHCRVPLLGRGEGGGRGEGEVLKITDDSYIS